MNIKNWIQTYVNKTVNLFGNRIYFIGLQGSYGRGDATEHSDIDVVLILDYVHSDDLSSYSQMLDQLPFREKACGFISGKEEIFHWEASDLFQFYFDTIPIIGSLDELREKISTNDICQAIHTGTCNIYHLCAHNIVHEKEPEAACVLPTAKREKDPGRGGKTQAERGTIRRSAKASVYRTSLLGITLDH